MQKNKSHKYGIKILSLNVRGINDLKKRRSVFYWAKKQKADIVFLQETYNCKDTENRWRNEWGGKVLYCHGTKHSRGIAGY
jgi:exonuclease III